MLPLLDPTDPAYQTTLARLAEVEESVGRLQQASDHWLDLARQFREMPEAPRLLEACILAKVGQLAVKQQREESAITWLAEAYRYAPSIDGLGARALYASSVLMTRGLTVASYDCL